MLLQDLKNHPCYRPYDGLSHRSGGFGGTCERCGTEIKGPNNTPINDVVSWRPVARPKPYQAGSLDEAIFEITRSVGMTDRIVEVLRQAKT